MRTPEHLHLVSVEPNGSEQLWPYTSRRESHDSATLPINVVVRKNAPYVRYLLTSSTGATWEPSESVADNASAGNDSSVESGVVLNGSSVEWTSARGSVRYTYVYNRTDGTGRWIDETYQLHDGTYLGTRYHLRLYEVGTGANRWTAIQAHSEHWDWFRLRHTVDSVDGAQDYMEGEFFGMWFLAEVDRIRFANGGALDADGWVSIIRLTNRDIVPPTPMSIGGIVGVVALRHGIARNRPRAVRTVRRLRRNWPIDPRYLALSVSLLLFPLAVRVSGITLERTFPTTSPKIFAGVLYLVVVVGIPACAFLGSRGLPDDSAPIGAAVAFGGGVLLDYAYLGAAVTGPDCSSPLDCSRPVGRDRRLTTRPGTGSPPSVRSPGSSPSPSRCSTSTERLPTSPDRRVDCRRPAVHSPGDARFRSTRRATGTR